MISIIISSYIPHYFSALEKNIAETIGIAFEIIKIDNPGLMGVCEAYNKGAEKAQYENLLFIHEDLIFHTQNWGEKLIAHLNQPYTGVIGVAGSDYVPSAPCSWTVISKINRNFSHLYQKNKNGTVLYSNISKPHPAFALDGVFLAIKKDKFDTLKFNEPLLKGFHGYDLDFTLRSAKKYKNYVIHDVLIEHFSTGHADETWFFSNVKIRKEIGCKFQSKNIGTIEKEAYLDFLKHHFRYHKKNLIGVLQAYRFYPFFKMGFSDHLKITKVFYLYLTNQTQ